MHSQNIAEMKRHHECALEKEALALRVTDPNLHARDENVLSVIQSQVAQCLTTGERVAALFQKKNKGVISYCHGNSI
jgi:hypothetical protein